MSNGTEAGIGPEIDTDCADGDKDVVDDGLSVSVTDGPTDAWKRQAKLFKNVGDALFSEPSAAVLTVLCDIVVIPGHTLPGQIDHKRARCSCE